MGKSASAIIVWGFDIGEASLGAHEDEDESLDHEAIAEAQKATGGMLVTYSYEGESRAALDAFADRLGVEKRPGAWLLAAEYG